MKNTSDEKYKVLNSLLDEEYILVHLSTCAKGVVIPEYLQSEPSVTLRLSRRFVGKMTVDKDLISADLLFNGEYFTCQIPIDALWGISTPKGMGRIWTESIPAGVSAPLGTIEPNPAEEAKPVTKGRPALKRVK